MGNVIGLKLGLNCWGIQQLPKIGKVGFVVRFRCEIAEKSLHITCVSLNNKRGYCITPRSLLKRMFHFPQSRPSVGFLLIASRMRLELKTFPGNSQELFCKMMVICGAQIVPSHSLYSSSSDLS